VERTPKKKSQKDNSTNNAATENAARRKKEISIPVGILFPTNQQQKYPYN
jgi:hypothetical protein